MAEETEATFTILMHDPLPSVQPLPRARLSERQRQICEMLANDQSDKQIAAVLGMTEDGVRYHLQELQWKLCRKTRAGIAVAYERQRLRFSVVGANGLHVETSEHEHDQRANAV